MQPTIPAGEEDELSILEMVVDLQMRMKLMESKVEVLEKLNSEKDEMIKRIAQNSSKVSVLTGNYTQDNTTLPLPDGFTESECKFFWRSQNKAYNLFLPQSGETRNAKMFVQGGSYQNDNGTFMVIGVK